MNILFITLQQFEDFEEKGIYTDLMREFIKHNHNVYAISPNENISSTKLITINNSKILSLKIGKLQKTNTIRKGLTTLTIDSKFKSSIKKYFHDVKFDLILYATPPISFISTIRFVIKRDNAISYLLLKDIFPQNAVDLEMLSANNIITKYFRSKEKELYRISDYIGCMSPANKKFILDNNPNLNSNKIEVNPNTIEPHFEEIDEVERFIIREKYDIPLNKTIFIYGGNLGIPQGVDFLIKCIDQSTNEKAFYLIVGTGTEFNKLKQYFENKKPKNAKIINFLPKEDYEVLVRSSDVGLIFLDNRFSIPNFPSRLLSYMQAGMPVIAATDPNTDVGKIMEENNFGLWSVSIDPKEFHNNVEILCDEETRKIYGENAKNYLTEHYTVKKTYEIIMNRLKERNEMRL